MHKKITLTLAALCSLLHSTNIPLLTRGIELEITTLNEQWPEELCDGEQLPICNPYLPLETTFLYKKTADFPRCSGIIRYNKTKSGELHTLNEDNRKSELLYQQIQARKNSSALFKSPRDNTSQFCVEFKFAKQYSPALTVTIYAAAEICDPHLVSFLKKYTEYQRPISNKTILLSAFAFCAGLFWGTETKYKKTIKKSYNNRFRRAIHKIKPAIKYPAGTSLEEKIKILFKTKGAKKELLTTKDLWGDTLPTAYKDIESAGQAWVKGKKQTAILVVKISDFNNNLVLRAFLKKNKDVSHTETRSAESLSTGTGYGTYYTRQTNQSIKTANRILLINDEGDTCASQFAGKSAFAFEGKSEMYGQVDSRPTSEIEGDLVDAVSSDTFKRINKFFDLGASLI
jgi:hypothetical protein